MTVMTLAANSGRGAHEGIRSTFDGAVRRAFSSQATLFGRREHCSLDPNRLAALGLVSGAQVRIRKRDSAEVAVYTVSETRQEPIDTTVRMAMQARERLGTPDEMDVTVDAQVPHPVLSDDEAETQSELVERLNDNNGCPSGLVVLAPHGGAIEAHTDSQAERVGALLGHERVSVWRCKGFAAGGGAFDRWHITSTEIHDASFPLLRRITTRGFTHAIAFHGFSEADVLVGGAAPLTLKQEIAAALTRALAGTGIPVRIAAASDHYNGDDPANIVNRLTAGGANGVQIEQSLEARREHWTSIAYAVAAVYADKLPRHSRG